ncbi:hypothetical protein NC652_011760 [Populus alba x Populus x berolinensis]|nr:hypothetical protein NC652_011760 [Populus alba x Populus x berolinensis]
MKGLLRRRGILIQCCWMQTGALKGYWKVKRSFAWMQRNLETLAGSSITATSMALLSLDILVKLFFLVRCYDSNLIEIPVEVETPDHHCYRLAFFATMEEIQECLLLQDYGIQFDDNYHPFKTFKCKCGSMRCHDKNRKENIMKISESNMYVMVA